MVSSVTTQAAQGSYSGAQAATGFEPINAQGSQQSAKAAPASAKAAQKATLKFQFDRHSGVLTVQDSTSGKTIYELRMGSVQFEELSSSSGSQVDVVV